MKLRSTLTLLLLTTSVGVYILLVEIKRPSSREAAERAQLVIALDRSTVDSISIKNTETRIELRKKADNVWYLEEPIKDRADPLVVSQLFSTAESLHHDRMLDKPGKGHEKSQLKDFGITNSEVKLKFSGTEKPVELVLGKDAAVDGKIYTKVEGAENVYVISNDLKTQLTRKADDFRDHRLTSLSPAQVQKVTFKSALGEIELEKKNEQWILLKPLNARGDNSKIGDFISQAATAPIDAFMPDSANLAAYGLQEPRGTVSFFMEGAKEPVVLQIGAKTAPENNEKEGTYAKLSTRNSVVLLPKAMERLLETKPNDLRDKKLVRLEADIVDRITLEPAGREKIVLARRGEDWVRKGNIDKLANAAAANKLLNTIKEQLVAKFVTDIATDLPKYGLDQPQLKVTLSSFASENTAETKAGELPIVTIFFGKMDGDLVYAKLDDEPFIVSLPKSFFNSFLTDPIRWQPLSVYHFKPEELTAIEITRAGQPPMAIERDKEKWNLAKGDGNINQINAQSLVNTLAALRAVRWTGPAEPSFGFDPAVVTVTFKTNGNVSGKLRIGSQTPEEMSHATADGIDGAFELSKPDRQAFDLALLEPRK